jgi:acetyl esterase
MADGGFPPGIADKIKAIGAKFDEDINLATRALYAPLVKDQPSSGVAITDDLAYGDDPRQKFDLYRPAGRRLPILIYVPGGGFVRGDKNADGVFFRNIGIYFARHGYLTAVMNYRLAPANPWPAGSQDVGGIVAWARKEGEAHGGDGNRVFLYGQSAGATHVAGYLFDPQFHPASGVGVTAAVLMSGGGYRIGANPAPNQLAYYGGDPSQYEARAPMTHVGKSKVPLLLSTAEYDPGGLAAGTYDLARAVCLRDGKAAQFVFFRGHNHVSTVDSIGSSQDEVGARVREFLGGF